MFKKTLIATFILCGAMSSTFANLAPQRPDAKFLSDPKINQLWQIYLKQSQSAAQKSDAVRSKLKAMEREQKNRMKTMEANTGSYSNDTRVLAIAADASDITYFNPLMQQFLDATTYIMEIPFIASLNKQELMMMRNLALDAGSNAHTPEEFANLDEEFQGFKSFMAYSQTVKLANGTKQVGGGNLKITLGDDEGDANTLTIAIPSFTLSALGLTNLHIDNRADAMNAVDAIDNAVTQMDAVLTIANGVRINDAIAMLWTGLSRMDDVMSILVRDEGLANASASGSYKDERPRLNELFSQQKDLLQATQTYVSLSGAKAFGHGNIHIQMGNQNTPETTLTIKLPITDLHLTGLDAADISTQAGAEKAVELIDGSIHRLVYND